jgi:hypothetical protein
VSLVSRIHNLEREREEKIECDRLFISLPRPFFRSLFFRDRCFGGISNTLCVIFPSILRHHRREVSLRYHPHLDGSGQNPNGCNSALVSTNLNPKPDWRPHPIYLYIYIMPYMCVHSTSSHAGMGENTLRGLIF